MCLADPNTPKDNCPALPRELPNFFWHFLKAYKPYIAGLCFVVFWWALHNTLSPYILKLMVDAVATHQQNIPLMANTVFWPAIIYVVLGFVIGWVFRLQDYLIMKLAPALRRDVQQQMLAYLEGHSHQYFQNNFAGSLSNKISDMVRGVPEILFLLIDICLAPFIAILVAMVALYSVMPMLAVAVGGWTIIYLSLCWYFSIKGRSLAAKLAETRSIFTGKQVDSISNMLNIRLFARRAYETSYVGHYMQDVVKNDQSLQWYLLKVRIFQNTSMTALGAIIIYYLLHGVQQQAISAGDFALVLGVTSRIMDSLWNTSNQFVRLAQEIGTCRQAISIITQPHGLIDHPEATTLNVDKGEIEFDNVSFFYERNNNIFNNKNVSIQAGSKVGLVGFSGSGKTTFVHLILRFFDINGGNILIDGQNIAHVTQDSLHQSIALIPQDTSLFHRSLLENIRYGRLDASDEEVIEAAKKAYAHEFIQDIAEGYQALVGERGIKLSGGQRQRIAIARAILKNAPILILDEATSALDSVTEKYIQQALEELMKNRTTLVIAHRLSTLSTMDRILVFNKGEIIEDGNHHDLLALQGHYARMWHMQAGGFLPEKDIIEKNVNDAEKN
ncbi:MAG: ABC transporter ATP-binding protein [Alphaproteobacteria bacterium]